MRPQISRSLTYADFLEVGMQLRKYTIQADRLYETGYSDPKDDQYRHGCYEKLSKPSHFSS